MYQEYRDSINFVWVYSREAHPEEDPFFRPGFETRDLGWDHRYFITTTMDERAVRAGWMKTDLEPDAEMPMIIDYINSPWGEDDAIKSAYLGGGYYSGYIIDCDGSIIHSVNWAWQGPGGEWYGLPVVDVQELRNFLDEYLAAPPACYAPTADPPSPPPGKQGSPTVLVVDDDGGAAYEGYFKIPLRHLKKRIQVWDVSTNGSPSAGTLAEFDAVVWFTGAQSEFTLTETDQVNLATYLDGGGNLFLSGQDIGQDIGDTAFYRDYLHADFVEDDIDYFRLDGDDILDEFRFYITGGDGAEDQTSPSRIEPLAGATGLARYMVNGDPAWGALRWSGHYRVVYFAFGLEGAGERGAAVYRFKIMRNVMKWFDAAACPGDINLDGVVDLADFALFAVSMGGPGVTEPTAEVDPVQFVISDLDEDGDVDADDFSEFQLRFGTLCD